MYRRENKYKVRLKNKMLHTLTKLEVEAKTESEAIDIVMSTIYGDKYCGVMKDYCTLSVKKM